MLSKEGWVCLDFLGFPKYYVSNYGNVRSPRKILKRQINGHGYYCVRLYGAKNVQITVHRLVALAFIPNPDNLPEVNHKDGNKQNPPYG